MSGLKPRLSAAIMAHPAREGQVAELCAALDRDVPIWWDPEGKANGNGDRVWRQAREAWMMFDSEADWHLLLQDDAVPCGDLLAGLEGALAHVPAPRVVSAYLGNGRLVPSRWPRLAERADAVGASWVRTQQLMWGVAIALPTACIPDMVAWADRKAGMPDDMRVAAWAKRENIEVAYTWPSLVDHRAVPSLTKHHAHDRRAIRHHVGSATEIDWRGPTVSDPMLIRRNSPRSGPSRVRRNAGQPPNWG